MIRVLTHTGCVDVTDDHSLLQDDTCEEISPKDCVIGTSLKHLACEIRSNEFCTLTENEARIMGFFFGDGSCGAYNCNSGIKYSWALNNKSSKLIDMYRSLCQIVYPSLFEGL